uniref:Sad1 and UNC84 domain containing 5 n=1 Tax=Saimiri boliviensis boliviensis TaxID=39432 RepID=A0A2K6V8M8_SAIBB
MPRSSRGPADPGALLEDVASNRRPRRIVQRGQNASRMAEDPSSNMNDAFLLPVRINAQALGLTQCMLGCMCASCCARSSWRRQAFCSSVPSVRPRALPSPRWRYPCTLALTMGHWARHRPAV